MTRIHKKIFHFQTAFRNLEVEVDFFVLGTTGERYPRFEDLPLIDDGEWHEIDFPVQHHEFGTGVGWYRVRRGAEPNPQALDILREEGEEPLLAAADWFIQPELVGQDEKGRRVYVQLFVAYIGRPEEYADTPLLAECLLKNDGEWHRLPNPVRYQGEVADGWYKVGDVVPD